jgi:hypothetical protein
MSSKKVSERDVECLVVGGGPAGIYAFQVLRASISNAASLGLLESGPSLGGRSKSALHLIDSDLSSPFPILTGTLLAPPVVRWDRQWIPMHDVAWDDKDWVAELPQWQVLAQGLKTLLLEVTLPEASDDTFLRVQSPVNRMEKLADGRWEIVTPETIYRAARVVWAAGLKSFQNAFGKHEAQAFLVANTEYSSVAADFRGGVGLDIEIPRDTIWEDGFRNDGVFALPVRFESKLHLMIGVLHEEGDHLLLKTLTHAHQDVLSDPKTVSSLQKALRRAVKALVKGELPDSLPERWVISDRVLGHRLGTPWLFGSNSKDASLVFVGDESNATSTLDTLGALDSVAKLLSPGET